MKKIFLLLIPAIVFAFDICSELKQIVPSFIKYSTSKKEISSLELFQKRLNICNRPKNQKCKAFLDRADREIETIIFYFHSGDIEDNIQKAHSYINIYNSCLLE